MGDKLNRWKGLAVGIVGGLAGVIAMRQYQRKLGPAWFAESPAAEPDEIDRLIEQLPDIEPVAGRQYRDGESADAAAGRILYTRLVGEEPQSAETRHLLAELVTLGWGVLMGIAYGYSRATTRGRDLAGGFFYGIRLFAGWTAVDAWLGIAEQPKRISRHQHFVNLTGYWVYSFVTTAVTRFLYRLL
jgi:hypothetical protein